MTRTMPALPSFSWNVFAGVRDGPYGHQLEQHKRAGTERCDGDNNGNGASDPDDNECKTLFLLPPGEHETIRETEKTAVATRNERLIGVRLLRNIVDLVWLTHGRDDSCVVVLPKEEKEARLLGTGLLCVPNVIEPDNDNDARICDGGQKGGQIFSLQRSIVDDLIGVIR